MTTLPSGTWNLEPDATTVTVTVKKLGVITVPATLTVTSGSIEIDESGAVTSVQVAADAASYASKNPKRNEHVVGPDFLDAATHPTISFEASSVAASGSGYTASGSVTVKGTTAPVTVAISDVAVSGDAGTFTASLSVDRNSVGVDKLPSLVIAKMLEISVAASAVRSS